MNGLLLAALLVLLLNVPFGYGRAGARRFTRGWFLWVHAPVPLAIGIRYAAGVGFRPTILPLFFGAYFLGQFAGGRLRRWRLERARPRTMI